MYAPVVTLWKENDKKLLEQYKSWFKRTIKWNKYRSQMAVQSNNNNLNYLIGPTFSKVDRLFVLPLKRIGENNVKKDHRNSFSHYYVPNVEIKDFNILVDGKTFFDLPVKNEKEPCKKSMRRNNDYTTGNLLDFAYFKEIADNKQQQTNFIGKLKNQANRAKAFFIIEKSEETTFEFLQNSVNIL